MAKPLGLTGSPSWTLPFQRDGFSASGCKQSGDDVQLVSEQDRLWKETDVALSDLGGN
jgi:hypothetical protein